ncbi:uncharacterized protein DNG_05214 [Cephalotrichum gorgonifer]|uniref:PNPLA domain-containing protein n=1 Tax=Cephalotrichum gorgonifer TaxID=2041049 RepID=A0AAE8MXF4_9PEZI|nr:uncharacterized protein DNG_05214 [Cephalotrichum gorgonifer]
MEEAVKKIIESETGSSSTSLKSGDETECKTECKAFVCTISKKDATRIHLFRSYEIDNDSEHPCKIWEAIRATSAAPTYFEPISIGRPGMTEEFIDGGVGCNNPILVLHVEAGRVFDSTRKVACILSIGTGTKGPLMLDEPGFLDEIGLHRDIVKLLKRLAVTSDGAAQAMDEKYKDIKNLYFRFSVEQGLASVKLGDWEKLVEIGVQTRAYLKSPGVDEKIDLAARAIIGSKDGETDSYYTVGHLSENLKTVMEAERHKQMSSPSWFLSGRTRVNPARSYDENLAKRFAHDKSNYESCSWIFNHPSFLTYKNDNARVILSLVGQPGSGKSVLAAAIIDHLKTKVGGSHTLFFFCQNHPSRTTFGDLLSGLLSQMEKWEEPAAVRAMDEFKAQFPDRQESELLNLFHRCLAAVKKKVYIILDDIKACDSLPFNIIRLLSSQGGVGDQLLSSVMLTFQPCEDAIISPAVANSHCPDKIQTLSIDLPTDESRQDFDQYVRHSIDTVAESLRWLTPQMRQDMSTAVQKGAGGLFLLVDLVYKELLCNPPSSLGDFKNTVERTIAGSLEMVYKRQLEEVKRKRKGVEVYLWAYAARRLLSWDEIKAGMAIVDGQYREEEMIQQAPEKFLHDACGHLLELTEDREPLVRLINPTVKEALDGEPGRVIGIPSAQRLVATKLLDILMFPDIPDFSEDPKNVTAAIFEYVKKPGRQIYEYAVLNWYKHVRFNEPDGEGDLRSKLERFLKSSASLSWLVAILEYIGAGNREVPSIVDLVQDVTTSLLCWRPADQSPDETGAEFGKLLDSWTSDLRRIFVDWHAVFEKRRGSLFSLIPELFPPGSLFRELLEQHAGRSSRLILFNGGVLNTRSTLKPTWANSVFSVDEVRHLAFACSNGYLQCYHVSTGIQVMEVPLSDSGADHPETPPLYLHKAVVSFDKRFMALLFIDVPARVDGIMLDSITNIRDGLHIVLTDAATYSGSWKFEEPTDEYKMPKFLKRLGIPGLLFRLYLVELHCDQLSGTRIFSCAPGRSSYLVDSRKTFARWRVDDPDFLAFSHDGITLHSPFGTVSLENGALSPRVPQEFDKSDLRSVKLTDDCSSLVAVKSRKLLQVLNAADGSLREEIEVPFSGILNILGVSSSGRYVAILSARDNGTGRANNRGSQKKACVRYISIYDGREKRWVDILVLASPRSQKKSLAFQDGPSPFRATFAVEGEEKTEPKGILTQSSNSGLKIISLSDNLCSATVCCSGEFKTVKIDDFSTFSAGIIRRATDASTVEIGEGSSISAQTILKLDHASVYRMQLEQAQSETSENSDHVNSKHLLVIEGLGPYDMCPFKVEVHGISGLNPCQDLSEGPLLAMAEDGWVLLGSSEFWIPVEEPDDSPIESDKSEYLTKLITTFKQSYRPFYDSTIDRTTSPGTSEPVPPPTKAPRGVGTPLNLSTELQSYAIFDSQHDPVDVHHHHHHDKTPPLAIFLARIVLGRHMSSRQPLVVTDNYKDLMSGSLVAPEQLEDFLRNYEADADKRCWENVTREFFERLFEEKEGDPELEAAIQFHSVDELMAALEDFRPYLDDLESDNGDKRTGIGVAVPILVNSFYFDGNSSDRPPKGLVGWTSAHDIAWMEQDVDLLFGNLMRGDSNRKVYLFPSMKTLNNKLGFTWELEDASDMTDAGTKLVFREDAAGPTEDQQQLEVDRKCPVKTFQELRWQLNKTRRKQRAQKQIEGDDLGVLLVAALTHAASI